MKVLVVEPGYAPYEKDIEGLHGMQEVVGGTITAIYPFAEPVAVVGNDDSISLGMPFNRSMEGGYGGVFGPFFVCALEEDHFGSLTTEQMETYKKKFHMAELLIGAKDNTPAEDTNDPAGVEPRQKAQVPDRDKKSKKRER